MKKKVTEKQSECSKEYLAIKDAMDILRGKWKIHIIGTLTYKGPLRFMDLLRLVDGIAAKMLSKELHDLEVNLLIKRTVLNTKPVTVEYELTPHGKTLERAINEIRLWGIMHRKKIIGKYPTRHDSLLQNTIVPASTDVLRGVSSKSATWPKAN